MDISILSLIVAVLAVVIGPCVSLTIARRQVCASLGTADKQITAPMRQAWINKLRELLAEFTANVVHGRVAGGVEKRPDEYNTQLLFLLSHIELMLNPNEDDHQHLGALMQKMVGKIGDQDGTHEELSTIRADLLDLSRKILKREWDRVKEPIQE